MRSEADRRGTSRTAEHFFGSLKMTSRPVDLAPLSSFSTCAAEWFVMIPPAPL
jgi:hypothetical protein